MILSTYQKRSYRPFSPTMDGGVIGESGAEYQFDGVEWARRVELEELERAEDGFRLVMNMNAREVQEQATGEPEIFVRGGIRERIIGFRHGKKISLHRNPKYGWIDPDGRLFPCRYGEHARLEDILSGGRGWLEDSGWVHVGPEGARCIKEINEAQAKTLMELT